VCVRGAAYSVQFAKRLHDDLHISLGGEGNALYPALCSYTLATPRPVVRQGESVKATLTATRPTLAGAKRVEVCIMSFILLATSSWMSMSLAVDAGSCTSQQPVLLIPRSHLYCLSLSLCLEWYNGSITPRVHSGVTKPAQCRLHYDRPRPCNKCVKPLSGVG